jgi:hypothetical protein
LDVCLLTDVDGRLFGNDLWVERVQLADFDVDDWCGLDDVRLGVVFKQR